MRETDTLSAQQEPTKSDASAANPLGEQTLKLAGFSYILGDAAMYAAGQTRKNLDVRWGALSWLVGGLGAGFYGNPNADRQLKIQTSKLERYLKQKGITIPDDARERSELLKKKSLWENVEQFFFEHPSEILNAGYAVGSGILIKDGLKELSKEGGKKSLFPKAFKFDHGMSSTFWIGTLVMAGALIGLLTKEDPKAREEAKDKDPIARAIAFVKEKPLRVSAGLYMANNVFLATTALEDFSKRNVISASGVKPLTGYAGTALKPHYFSTAQLALYLFANSMLMLSSRDQISGKGFDPQHMAELEKAAAQIIASQTPEVQQALLVDISNYLAKEKGIKVDATTLAAHLVERVGLATQARLSPAVSKVKWAEREAARASEPTLLSK